MTTNEQSYVSNSPVMGNVQRKFYEQLMTHSTPDFFRDLTHIFDVVNKQTYIDTGHLNPYGNFLIAENIASQIAPALT
jgi:lysophospholipase L1-like esterase